MTTPWQRANFILAAVPKKYAHIDFTPPEAVRRAAIRGLEMRKAAPKSRKGGLTPRQAADHGIGSGVQRAVNLKSGRPVSPRVIRMMVGFFSRHSAYRHKHKSDPTGRAIQSWLIWGGTPGFAWAKKILRQMKKADGQQESGRKKTTAGSIRLTIGVQPLTVLKDPTVPALIGTLGRSRFGSLRGLLTDDAAFYWDAAIETHDSVAEAIGVNPDLAERIYVDFRDGRPEISGLDIDWMRRHHRKHPHLRHLLDDPRIYFMHGRTVLPGPRMRRLIDEAPEP